MTKAEPTKPTENMESSKDRTPSIPPGQLKKEERSDENTHKTNAVKIEPPKKEKVESNTSDKNSQPKENDKKNQGNNSNHNNQVVPENKLDKK